MLRFPSWIIVWFINISYVLNEPILSIVKSSDAHRCVLTNDSSDSALVWDNQSGDKTCGSSCFCDIEKNASCQFEDKTDTWSWINTMEPLPVLDLRWESMENQGIEYKPPIQVYKAKGESFSLSFSFKAEEVHIFLCDAEYQYSSGYGNCYWINLGAHKGTESYFRKCATNAVPNYGSWAHSPCNYNHDTFQMSNTLNENQWKHFRVSKTKDSVEVWSSDANKTILNFEDNEFTVNYVYVREGEWRKKNYMKVHRVQVLSSHKTSTSTIKLTTNKPTCLALYVKKCSGCTLTFKLTGKDQAFNAEASKKFDEWERVILKRTDNMNLNGITEISVRCIIPNTSFEKYCYISSIIQACGHTDFPVKVGYGEGCCYALKYPNLTICTNNLTRKISPTGQECAPNEIGKNCLPCKPITGNDNCGMSKICETSSDITCSCASGYTGSGCTLPCGTGTYGHNCEKQCGNCKYRQTCNSINGHCQSCEDNFLKPKCDIPELPIVRNAPEIKTIENRRVTLSLNLDYNGTVEPKFYQLQYKIETHSDWQLVGNQLSDINSRQEKIIDHLQPNTDYTIRVILYTANIEKYDGNHVPKQQFKTTCTDINFNSIQLYPENNSISIQIKDNADLCPLVPFLYRLYQEEIPKTASVTSLASFSNLKPCTKYSIEILKDLKSIARRTVTTKEGAPGKVVALDFTSTDTSAELTWNDPPKTNCKIRKYSINYASIGRRRCNNYRSPNDSNEITVSHKHVTLEQLSPYFHYQADIRAFTAYGGDTERIFFTTKERSAPTEEEFPRLSITNPKKALEIIFNWDCASLQGSLEFKVQLICKNAWCTSQFQNGPSVLIGSSNLNLKHTFSVSAYTNYTLTMEMYRNDSKLFRNQDIPTLPAEPNPVQNVIVYSKSSTSLSIRWSPPYPPTGDIECYFIIYNSNRIKVEKASECKLWPGQICTKIANLTSQIVRFMIVAKNNGVGQDGRLVDMTDTAKEGVPEQPQNITLEWDQGYGLKITWKHPDRTNGDLVEFVLSINGQDISPYKVDTEEVPYKYNYSLPLNLTAKYVTIAVAARNLVGFSNKIRQSTYSPPKTPEFVTAPTIDKIKDTSFELQIPQVSIIEGEKSNLYIIITDVNQPIRREYELHPLERDLIERINLKVEHSWIMGEFDLKSPTIMEGFRLEVGNNSESVSTSHTNWIFKNRKLDKGKTYNVSIIVSNTYMNLSRYKIYTVSRVMEPTKPSSFSYFWILLVLPIVLCLLCVLVIRRYRKKPFEISFSARRIRSYIADRRRFRRNEIPMVSVPFTNQVSEEELEFSKEINIDDLYTYTKEAIENKLLAKQLEALPRGQTKPWVRGTASENRPKNRFTNLPAYDHSRVKLEIINGDPYSDYINANYVDGYKIEQAYIATQGPKASTVDDFWRMIWQENVENIVMLANIVEDGKTKVERYWPEMRCARRFGTVVVEYMKVETMANYEIRYFCIFCTREKRTVRQYHFQTWPDGGIPKYFRSLVPFCRKIATVLQGSAPIVVHSSVGIGRTGALILCDISLRMAKAEGKADVFHYLRKLREQRVNMVDTVEQYTLVHLLLIQCLVTRDTGIACDSAMEDKINDIAVEQIQKQMKNLDNTNWQNEAIRSANSSSNEVVVREKNRFKNIVPDPFYRVLLPSYPATDVSSTYINAVMVDSYLTVSKFIVTQNPMRNTLSDFWRLVDENKITTIISLNYLNLDDETTIAFYPTIEAYSILEPVPYLEIKCVDKEAKGHCEIYSLALTRLDFEENDVPIKLIQVRNWRYEMLHPEDPCELVKIYEEMIHFGKASEKILVTCYDGARASGLFMALCFLIDKIKMEHICDVYLAVSAARQSRKEFVREADQYSFLYKCALEYFRQFDIYANFNR